MQQLTKENNNSGCVCVCFLDRQVSLSAMLDSCLNVLGVVALQKAVGSVALEWPLQRVSQEFGHAVVQLDGWSTQGDLKAVTHSL